MSETTLFWPILIVFIGALLALLLGLSPLRQRLSMPLFAALLAIFSFSAFLPAITAWPGLNDGRALIWQLNWLPSLGLTLSLYYDSLSALFVFLVSGIGTLVLIYAGQYFKGDESAWRFLHYLMLFMGSMIGVVMAGDIITLFIFWEGTSITSYLLIAYKYKYEDAREGAFKSLFITGGGGVAMLGGLLMVAHVSGSTEFATILQSGEALRNSAIYPVMLALVAFGAFTKSAQFPAHIWLPGAMSAPTPASAYLHSATMVKAGVYLLARLNPALSGTEAWFWLLTVVGGITMLTGAYLGLKQHDLKALLAYSTVSQLGVFVMLIGQEVEAAFKALIIGILAHALYKSALFMVAGIVDHETGTRDITRLGGLRRAMPVSFVLATIGALSMAGLPPLFGFLAKETLLATAVHPTFTPLESYLLVAAIVAAGALLLAQSGLLVYETFLGQPKDKSVHAHEAPWPMLLAPAIPALLSLTVSLPNAKALEPYLASAAASAFGAKVKVSLDLWTGINAPLILSVVAISLGSLLFWRRVQVRAWQNRIPATLSFNGVYTGALRLIDAGAYWATRLQGGRLRLYLAIMLISMVGLVLRFGATLPIADLLANLTWPTPTADGELAILRIFSLVFIVVTALVSVLLERDFAAILAMGASGLGIVALMVLEPAPDVALVQVVVDILAMVILVLALARLPRPQRRKAQELTLKLKDFRPGLLWDGFVALSVGAVVTAVTLTALVSRPRESIVTPYFEANAKPLAGATDIVGAIIVDFRALDTLIEIAVFGMAGVGMYMLLRYAARKYGDVGAQVEELPIPVQRLRSLGIGGAKTSSFVRALAYFSLPLALVVAITHIMYGHDQPGDGFTSGVIVSLAVGFWYVVFGYYETQRRLPWLKYDAQMVSVGLLLVVLSGLLATFINGAFLSPVNFGEMLALPLPKGFYLSTAFLFEVAISLTVVGSVTLMLNTLGHPGQSKEEVQARLQEIAHLEQRDQSKETG